MKGLLLAAQGIVLLGLCYASPLDLTIATSVNLVSSTTPCLYAITPILQDGITKASWITTDTPLASTPSPVQDLYSTGRPYSCLLATASTAMPYCLSYAADAWASSQWSNNHSLCPSQPIATLIPDGSRVVIAPTTSAPNPYATIDPISGRTIVPVWRLTSSAQPVPTAFVS